jgi:metal-responsive CopG/Arc/MetJ family transcriptional regulator
MKTAISVPDELAHWFDAVALRHGMNRSEFYRRAGEHFAAELEATGRVAQINDAVASTGRCADPDDGGESARALIDAGGWQW